MLLRLILPLITLAFLWPCLPAPARADGERAHVAYTGVYLMGNARTKGNFPVYLRNQRALRDALRVEMKRVDEQGLLPFKLIFDTDMEEVKLRLDNTLSLALVVVRDDVGAESFNAAGTQINKTIVNVGITAILYDTRMINGQDRNTVVFSFPLVGYAQRLDGEKKCSDAEIDSLFIGSAVTALRENIVQRLARVTLSDIFGTVTQASAAAATVDLGATSGLEEGQRVYFLAAGKKVAAGTIVKLGKKSAVVEVPNGFAPRPGMKVRATNMRASSEETFQVVEVRVSSRKAAKLFPQEVIGPQAAQWFSNFLTDRGGKVVLPSRVGGEWDQSATGTAFTLVDRGGLEHRFELPPPRYPVSLDLTGVSSKVTESNDVNDVCMFKVWLKVSIPAMKYEKEFNAFSSKTLVKGVQSFEEKNELFDLLYQLTAKAAREAEI
ncbi:MAG TPA: hypothetical protein DCZ75_13195 [Geobacter sp.]|nr:hypothetical protein [Geobacter sp.]